MRASAGTGSRHQPTQPTLNHAVDAAMAGDRHCRVLLLAPGWLEALKEKGFGIPLWTAHRVGFRSKGWRQLWLARSCACIPLATEEGVQQAAVKARGLGHAGWQPTPS